MHIRSAWSTRPVALLRLLAAAACLPSFEQPDVRLESVRVGAPGASFEIPVNLISVR